MNLDSLLPKSPKPPKNLVYSYIDGSGNTYYIANNILQYDPMTAQYSSSGIYDGGKAAKVLINAEQFDAIKMLLQKVRQNESDHILNRVKGSGLVRFYQENDHLILAYNTNSKKELEVMLKKMMIQ